MLRGMKSAPARLSAARAALPTGSQYLAGVVAEVELARPAGFEPATWWSEATRSIH